MFGYCAAVWALLGRPGPLRRTGGEGGGVNPDSVFPDSDFEVQVEVLPRLVYTTFEEAERYYKLDLFILELLDDEIDWRSTAGATVGGFIETNPL